MSNQHDLEVAQSLGRIEGMLEGLCGPQGRVTKLEDAQKRQWWLTVAIGPALAIFHQALRKFGVQV